VPDGGVRLKGVHPPPTPEGLMVNTKLLVFVVQVSLTVDVTVYVPAVPVLGVPDIELPEHVRPAGQDGETDIFHEYGVLPPDAVIVAE
jgi:hypothetical protein